MNQEQIKGYLPQKGTNWIVWYKNPTGASPYGWSLGVPDSKKKNEIKKFESQFEIEIKSKSNNLKLKINLKSNNNGDFVKYV